MYIVDLFGFQLSPQHPRRTCLQNILSLMKELEMYDAELINRPAILLVNKIDKDGAEREFEELQDALENLESHRSTCPEEIQPTKLATFDCIVPMSAKEGIGLDSVRQDIRTTLDIEAEKALVEANSWVYYAQRAYKNSIIKN